MENTMSHWIMGVMSALFGMIGLFMAARARDFGIELFGLVLFAAAILFCWWMIKTACDEAEDEISAA
jgi:hypothetical protein